uniref:Uncharacterized protein n=1 Tax=Meloidogyne incognita TaxID=6306 RepID=A0A914MI53_MELIC
MSDNLQGVNDDLVSTLCSCSTSTFEDSLNRIKLLEVEKDKTNLAFQLILAKLDLGLCQDQTIIKQLQELNEKMSGNQVKDLAEDRDGQIKTLTERNAAYSDAKYEAEKKLKEINKVRDNKIVELTAELDKLNKENKQIVEKDKTNLALQLILAKLDLQVKDLAKEQAEQIKTLTERNVAFNDAKYEAEKKVEKDKTNLAFQLILAKLDLNFSANNPTFENQTIIKQLQELNEKMSGNQVKDLAENRVEQIKTLTERNAAYSDAKYEAEKKLKSLNDSRKEELDKLNKENDTKYIWQSANDSLNIKIVELTKELGRLNKDALIVIS